MWEVCRYTRLVVVNGGHAQGRTEQGTRVAGVEDGL